MSSPWKTSVDYIYTYEPLLKQCVDKIKNANNIRSKCEPLLITERNCEENNFKSTLSISFDTVVSFRCIGVGVTRKEAEKKALANIMICLNGFCEGQIEDKFTDVKSKNSTEIQRNSNGIKLPSNPVSSYCCPMEVDEESSLTKLESQSNISTVVVDSKKHSNIVHCKDELYRGNSMSVPSSHYDDFDMLHRDIINRLKYPLGQLTDFYSKTMYKYGFPHDVFKRTTIEAPGGWIGLIKVKYPAVSVFRAFGTNKKEALRRSAILCWEWLQDGGSRRNVPQQSFQNCEKDMEKLRISPPKQEKIHTAYNNSSKNASHCIENVKSTEDDIIIDPVLVKDAEDLLNLYENNLSSNIKKTAIDWRKGDMSLITIFKKDSRDRRKITGDNERNKELYDNLQLRNKKQHTTNKLPIHSNRDEILKLIERHQAVVLVGKTGCGKSTQVPQFVFDDWTQKMRGAECNIIVTQPRRISAITLAERIAIERSEQLQEVVGYQVRLKSMMPSSRSGTIVFNTIGILLRKMLPNPDLEGVTHLIIDEAHERDLHTDFLLLLAKRAIARNRNLRVIIMSATINSELFQKYFNDAPAFSVPGFTYKVDHFFLNRDWWQLINVPEQLLKESKADANPKVVAKMILWIDTNKPPGAILVFLPSWNRIQKVMYELQKFRNLHLLSAHSRLSYKEQREIFCKPPNGKRKVVLSTNITETSITIEDIIYVIDSGIHKEERRSNVDGVFFLDNQWISQASAKQRRGRAGRVQPGECYHLYTEEKFKSLDPFPIPEIHRVRLEKSILNAKIYSKNENAETFLSHLPEPPSREAIRHTVQILQSMQLLDEEENLTPLGTRVSVFNTSPMVAMALIYSFIFKCLNPILSISSVLSSEKPLFPGIHLNHLAIRQKKKRFSPSSDHLAIQWIYRQWEDFMKNSQNEARNFAEDYIGGSHDTFLHVKELHHLISNHLIECGFLQSNELDMAFDEYSDYNMYSANDELLKGVLLAGLCNVLVVNRKATKKKKVNAIFTRNGHEVTLYNESVNSGRKDFPSHFLTYFQEVCSLQDKSIVVKETTLLSPLTLVLFNCNSSLSINQSKESRQVMEQSSSRDSVILQLQDREGILSITCNERTARMLIALRQALWEVVDFMIREEGDPVDIEFYNHVKSFFARLLSLLNEILNTQAGHLDYDSKGNLRE